MYDVVAKLWSYCHVLRHDGVDYSDYVEQISYLLFLKMASEQNIELLPSNNWHQLRTAAPSDILDIYDEALARMARQSGPLGAIFQDSESRISSPESLERLVTMIDEINWTSLGIDVQASVFEGLLERAAAEGKKGAGQYFTPRPLIDCIVACAKPDLTARPNFKIIDPACGTGGFLASAHDWFIAHAAPAVGELRARQLSDSAYFGVDLVARPRRLALMNMYLRGVNAHIIVGDSIYGHHDIGRFNLVLTNPPFGSHGVRGIPHRPGYPVKTSNKQINFIQHSVRILMDGGLAAIVAPDNVLFSAQGTQALRAISETSSIHTILRCPNGTFTPYTQGTKTNVIFISKGTPTKTTWIYDARTGVRTISRRNPLTPNHFVEFTKCYGKALNSIDERTEADSSENRWRCFSVDVLNSREFRIDSLRWLDDNSEEQGQTAEPIKLIADALAALSRAEKGLQALQSLMRENTHDDT